MLSSAAQYGDGIAAVAVRDARRASSYRMALIASVISEVFSMVLFYFVAKLVNVEPFKSPDEYFAFVVVGLVALQLANAVLYFPLFLLSQELVAGTFERLVVSPLGAPAGLAAVMVVPFAGALFGSVAAIAFAAIAFGLSLAWPSVLLALPVGLLVGLSFAPLGLLLLAAAIVIKQAAALAGWLITALSLLAGLYFPVALLPAWVRWASDVQPLTPAVDLLRHVLIGTPLPDPAVLEVLKLAVFAAVLLPLALWVLTRAVNSSRQRGTIIEY